MRRSVPNWLMRSGCCEPFGFSKRSAGPPDFTTRSVISVISRSGSASAVMRRSSPSRSRSAIHSRRSRGGVPRREVSLWTRARTRSLRPCAAHGRANRRRRTVPGLTSPPTSRSALRRRSSSTPVSSNPAGSPSASAAPRSTAADSARPRSDANDEARTRSHTSVSSSRPREPTEVLLWSSGKPRGPHAAQPDRRQRDRGTTRSQRPF